MSGSETIADNNLMGPRRAALPSLVRSSKSSTVYQGHSYPTKLPPEAVVPFIEASTHAGALVLDPFCGSGMVGVACRLIGRQSILSDLSPGATHLARGYTQPVLSESLSWALAAMETSWLNAFEEQLYSVSCPTCSGPALTRHVIWSDVYRCQQCRAEISVLDFASTEEGQVPRSLKCPACSSRVRRAGVAPVRTEPAKLVAKCQGSCQHLQSGRLSDANKRRLAAVLATPIERWVPTNAIEPTREMYKRSALHLHDIGTVADFFMHRSKLALSELWYRISLTENPEIRQALRFAFTNTAWHCSRMRRYNLKGGQRPLTGTLYIPQLIAEANVFQVFRHQIGQIAKLYQELNTVAASTATVRKSSATSLGWLGDETVDYVFTDPPFGANIFYGDCNIVWEAWLGEVTDTEAEIVVNRSRTPTEGGKTIADYEGLLSRAFSEMRRVLKRDGRISVVFHNSDDQVWAAMLDAAEMAGLQQSEVSMLDKGQRSMKGYKGRSGAELVPFYDLVITFVPVAVPVPQLNGAGEIALKALREHLSSADASSLPSLSHERSLEFLYSLAVGQVIHEGYSPEGLSFRSFETLLSDNFARDGHHFALVR